MHPNQRRAGYWVLLFGTVGLIIALGAATILKEYARDLEPKHMFTQATIDRAWVWCESRKGLHTLIIRKNAYIVTCVNGNSDVRQDKTIK